MARKQRTINSSKSARTPATPPSLTDQVYNTVKDEIIRVQWQPGELLLEPKLAERYGISKTPVREALRLLVHDGWVVGLPRKGYMVQPLELADIREVFLLRELVEPGLAIEAARGITEAQLESLRDLVKSQGDMSEDIADPLHAAQEFHLRIAVIAGVNRGVRAISGLLDEVRRLHHLMPGVGGHITSDAELRAHEQLVDILAQQDEEAAATLMREHLREVARTMVNAFVGTPAAESRQR